jgi:hypothetical protein
MEAMREAWTDRRLDGLDHKVDQFELRVDEQMSAVVIASLIGFIATQA